MARHAENCVPAALKAVVAEIQEAEAETLARRVVREEDRLVKWQDVCDGIADTLLDRLRALGPGDDAERAKFGADLRNWLAMVNRLATGLLKNRTLQAQLSGEMQTTTVVRFEADPALKVFLSLLSGKLYTALAPHPEWIGDLVDQTLWEVIGEAAEVYRQTAQPALNAE